MADRSSGEARADGFTIVELVVALTLIAGVLVSMAYVVTGGLGAYASARQRSNMVEVANGQIESLRAAKYDSVGVDPPRSIDSRDAVSVAAPASPAHERVEPSDVPGVLWYEIDRWVTWTDADGGNGHELKRLDVTVTWPEQGSDERLRSFHLSSLLYPGGLGAPAGPGSNVDPDALFTFSPGSPSAGTPVTFTNLSTDPNGDPLTYVWTIEAMTITDPNPMHTFASPGTYPVTLQVQDGAGGIDTVSQNVVVSGPNLSPTASFTLSSPPSRPDVVTVDASASTDPEGGPLSYSWDWGDGSPAGTGQLATHRYLSTGMKTITLVVTDNAGATSTATVTQNVGSVGCTVISGGFRNPSTNSTTNSIMTNASGKPDSASFQFFAETTIACNSLQARLPLTSGSFIVPLSNSAASTTKMWVATTNISPSEKFNLGTNQTGQYWTPADTGADHKFPFPFSVARS